MERRKFLIGAGSIAGATALGVSTMPTGATSESNFTIADAPTVVLDDGDVSFVDVEATKEIAWDGFDSPVKYISFSNYVDLPNNDNVDEHALIEDNVSGELPDGWSGNGDADGWGGDDEYVVNYGGDTDGTEGRVHTSVDWRIIGSESKSIETPASWQDALDTSESESPQEYTVSMRSEVTLLDADKNPISHDAAAINETATFVVPVKNEQSTTEVSGDGQASGG